MKRAYPMVVSMLLTVLALALGGARPALAATPPNDDISGAVQFSTLPFTAVQDTSGATEASGDVSCFPDVATVWYAFTPTTDVSVRIDTAGSDYDTTLTVSTDVGTGSASTLSVVGCDDNTTTTQQSALAFQALAGKTYFILVGSRGPAPGGNLTFRATEFPISARIDPQVTFDPGTGVVTVTTALICDASAFISLIATRIQLLTDGTIGPSTTALARPLVTCAPGLPLTLTLRPLAISERGKRRGGPALVSSEIIMTTGGEDIHLSAQAEVMLIAH